MTTYGPVEKAARAELRLLRLSVQTSAAAAALVSVAKRLDEAKGAASAAAAAREVRLAVTALHVGQDDTLSSELADLFDEFGRS